MNIPRSAVRENSDAIVGPGHAREQTNNRGHGPLLQRQSISPEMITDLAECYGVETKRLNEQVRHNSERFPEDFMLQLTAKEKAEVVANCDHLAKFKYSPT